jgi:hypothetical protein
VRRFGERVMQGVNPAMAAVGPVGKLEKHSVFARRFGSSAGSRTSDLPGAKLRLTGEADLSAAGFAKAE